MSCSARVVFPAVAAVSCSARRTLSGVHGLVLPGLNEGLIKDFIRHYKAVSHRLLSTKVTPIKLTQISSKLSQNQGKTTKAS